MATSFVAPVSAFQVGSYFVRQYYQVLQEHPEFVHQFYTDASTVIRVDGDLIKSATTMLEIHSLVLSLNFTGIEIKTAHSLDSWSGGILVMVSGSVQTKDYNGRRKFVHTFFLAPQEKGYFVLNDIFHFFGEEQIHQHPAALLTHSHFDSQLNTSNPLQEPVSDYMRVGETQAREFVPSSHVEENDSLDNYSLPEHPQQQVPEADNLVEEIPVEESNPSYPTEMNTTQDSSPVPVEEPTFVGEPPKKTYASILRVAMGQPASSVAPQPLIKKSAPPPSEWHHTQQPTQQFYSALSMDCERSGAETVEEVTTIEEGECRSVYVRNLPSTVTDSEIEREFNNFGRIKPEGVAIRNRQDLGICYAFVEFEDAIGVQNAIKASPIQLGGRQVHIEERRANGTSTYRGGRRGGRGRGGYLTEATRGRFGGRSYGRGNGQGNGDRDYTKSNGNGNHQQRGPRQDRGIFGNQVSRNEHNPWEATA